MSDSLKNTAIGMLAAACLVLSFLAFRNPAQVEHAAPAVEATAEVWTCSMHPQIKAPEPGDCPVCGMDLIPLEEDSAPAGSWELTLSEHARKLAEIETARVERRTAPRLVRMDGRITYDEKRVGVISARVSGRIDRLYVDYTGIEVRRGDHMVELYSPDLVTARQELKMALRSYRQGHESLQAAAQRRLEATREKLRLLGFSNQRIAQIEAGDESSPHLTIEAPTGGVVIEKHLKEGAYVKVGTPIYTVADLSRVWVTLDAYESDLAWLRFGQEVQFEVEAWPGEVFSGRIAFIDQVLDPATRTVKVRMDIANPEGRFKPDMFVRARVEALIGPGGKVMDPAMTGKWLCPMHPEEVSDEAGACAVCGMDLVRAEALGFTAQSPTGSPLLIPVTAPLITGETAVVYVAVEPGVYLGRQVVLGPRIGNWYLVRSGLEEGERVVVHGAFKIDSELQIRTGRGMMYPAPAAVQSQPGSEELADLLRSYFALSTALSDDNAAAAVKAAVGMDEALHQVDPQAFAGADRDLWARISKPLEAALHQLNAAADLSTARQLFLRVSEQTTMLVTQLGVPAGQAVYQFSCPMAFDDGADWLQDNQTTANPYYGSEMYGCGSLSATLAKPGSVKGHDHD